MKVVELTIKTNACYYCILSRIEKAIQQNLCDFARCSGVFHSWLLFNDGRADRIRRSRSNEAVGLKLHRRPHATNTAFP